MITRRDFLKTAGAATLAVAAASVLAGCSSSGSSSSNNNKPAPAPKPEEPVTPVTGKSFTLANGVTLTIEDTARMDAGAVQYVGVKIKLDNTTAKDVSLNEYNFKANPNGEGEWVYAKKGEEMSDAQKNFLLSALDAPWIGYYEEELGQAFGTAGTCLEAALLYTLKKSNASNTSMDLYVTYGSKVFKTTVNF